MAAAAAPATFATEVCVTCSGPPANYRCTVDEASKIEGYRYGKKALQFICITELAREGGHEKCSVKRTGSDICVGQERTVSLKGSIQALSAPMDTEAEAEPGSVTGAEQPVSDQPKKPEPPKTVEELARRTASASKEKLEKTGNTVGKAFKKGLGCIASLFQDC